MRLITKEKEKIKKKKNEQKNKKPQTPQQQFFEAYLIIIAIVIILLVVFHAIIPIALNYPENTLNNAFQDKVVGIGYTKQFVLFSVIQIIITSIILYTIYKSVTIKSDNIKDVLRVRDRCFNYPFVVIVSISFGPAVILAILLWIFNTNLALIANLFVLTLSIGAIIAVSINIATKNFFEIIIKNTSDIADNNQGGIRVKLSTKIVYQILPVVITSFIILIIVLTNTISEQKGDLLYKSYNQELNTIFDKNEIYDLKDIRKELSKVEIFNKSDKIVLLEEVVINGQKKLKPIQGKITKFAEEYILQITPTLPEDKKNQIYTEYGKMTEISIIKVKGKEANQYYYVGVQFQILEPITVITFILIVTVLVLLDVFYFVYIANSIREDISKVTNGMKSILQAKNNIIVNNLPVTSNDETGDLVLAFNMIQNNNNKQVKRIYTNQQIIVEQERLASLGQMIGGIAHNLKTPIFSISGAGEALEDLIDEYEESLDIEEVTKEDMLEIGKEMKEWVEKIKVHVSYMSNVITAVKGQAVTLSETEDQKFLVKDLFKNIKTLMEHELKRANIELEVENYITDSSYIRGTLNSLIQILNNIISNSIDSYNGESGKIILKAELINGVIRISVQDFGSGMPEKVKEKAFKEMITTKGKKGTGLGLYMSYSTIKGQFKGQIELDSEEGKGTKITIYLPEFKV